ncbi:MAG: diguanylate cyclase [Gammaproteobacteria bacterium]|nr:diguanylate cyclase [Gammaproteobacteria bacterium]MBT8151788.1 diguanylate cyclase [Gammaproteobacteria bacterium]NND39336.1 diguanylate cyclase [Pseudomonadales bacterium]NNL11421.1 diguanylate cyclase [Pseudomonadales bacterium]NNM12062.1 diguanylate cyclase [Pseudomonadales bacterium]
MASPASPNPAQSAQAAEQNDVHALRALSDACAQLLALGPDLPLREALAGFLERARAADAEGAQLLPEYVVLQRSVLESIAPRLEQTPPPASLSGLPVYARVADAIEGSLGRVLAQFIEGSKHAAGALDLAEQPLAELAKTIEQGINWYELAALLDAVAVAVADARGAGIDSATGLPVGGQVEGQLHNELERLQRFGHGFSVACLEIVEYSELQAHFGLAAAEKALRLVARIAGGALRGIDYIGRSETQSLLIIMPGTSATDASALLEDIDQLVQRSPFHFAGKRANVSLRLGIVDALATDTAHILSDRAHQALASA